MKDRANCNHCGDCLKTGNGSGSLKSHLQYKHPQIFRKYHNEYVDSTIGKKRKVEAEDGQTQMSSHGVVPVKRPRTFKEKCLRFRRAVPAWLVDDNGAFSTVDSKGFKRVIDSVVEEKNIGKFWMNCGDLQTEIDWLGSHTKKATKIEMNRCTLAASKSST